MNSRDILNWLNESVAASHFSLKQIDLKYSREWRIVDGVLSHTSGRFFSVRSFVSKHIHQKPKIYTLIDQQEVGTLGFLARKKNNHIELLTQAKIEPGNVGIAQLSPTLQATSSNADQVHGGAPPEYITYFTEKNSYIISDTLHSEQGSRFYKKKNRNVLAFVKDEHISRSSHHQWIQSETLLDMISHDYTVNTDARSVLVTSDWKKLITHTPFTRFNTNFSNDLRISYEQPWLNTVILDIKKRIKITEKRSTPITRARTVSLATENFTVIHVSVFAQGREVSSWNQPLISSNGNGYVGLVCAQKKGVLTFGFNIISEVGLYTTTALSPTIIIEPGSRAQRPKINGSVIIESKQSEEGGRFYHDSNTFQIIHINNDQTHHADYWLNLKEITSLLQQEGYFTNEARSALSLLLKWL